MYHPILQAKCIPPPLPPPPAAPPAAPPPPPPAPATPSQPLVAAKPQYSVWLLSTLTHKYIFHASQRKPFGVII